MPHANIYIRNEDLDKWNSIEKKSEFIHNALTNFGHRAYYERLIKVATKEAEPTPLTPKQMLEDRRMVSCKHGYDPRFCKHAKGGKPCK